MVPKHNFRKLKIWQDGISLVTETYKTINSFPESQKFNLVSQLARCSVSIPSNIAEGTSKSSEKHFNKYLEDSLGSCFEWETQMIVAYNLNYINEEQYNQFMKNIQKIQGMITNFQNGLNKSYV